MRTIYIVYYDWAINDGSDEGILGVYEHLDDAIAKMDEWWQDERDMGYLEEFDEFECDERKREGWTDGYYFGSHTRIEVREQYLYSSEDVANGLA
jgi:hypothetical protein